MKNLICLTLPFIKSCAIRFFIHTPWKKIKRNSNLIFFSVPFFFQFHFLNVPVDSDHANDNIGNDLETQSKTPIERVMFSVVANEPTTR